MATIVHDCVVVGAGASGLVAAIFAARGGLHTLVLERGNRPCRKLLLAGGGRGSVLPPRVSEIDYLTEGPHQVIRQILTSWSLAEIRHFFEQDLGVPLILDAQTGRYLPRSQKAEEVASALERVSQSYGARLRFGAQATAIRPLPDAMLEVSIEGSQPVRARAVVLSPGGASWPDTGSDGWGYEVAKRLGHTIVPTYPALVPLASQNPAHRELSGISLPTTVRVYGADRKLVAESRGALAFTHFGYAGTAILNVAHFAWRGKVRFEVSWRSLNRDRWQELLRPSKTAVARALSGLLPQRLAQSLIEEARVEPAAELAKIRREERERLIKVLAEYPLPAVRGPGFEAAEGTGGGIPFAEIDPATLESRVVPGLYIAGEIPDAFGRVGGYNLLWCWITGRLAGASIARRIPILQPNETESTDSPSMVESE
ncbi:MAG: aminoacetone oxidase family FAD-binding enzyme [Planctomycetes bacterium]|nr:aminoacetone oxidase family FAD-binding enzyme [Planctomycetota bacterium]